MTWGWAVRGDNLGTPAESAVKATWPDYNAEYLKKKLNGQQRRFDPDDLDDIEKHVYLQQSVKGYEAEAEACLKEEFKQWLQGTHEANVADEMGNGYYVNNDGGSGPKRRHVYDGVVSAEMADNGAQGTGWRATRWGTKQLTHLDGVRDFLRAGRIQQDNAERDMNLLAERGPQDLNEAWMYFKHWVKKRPVTTCDEFGQKEQKNRLNAFQVDRMNGTGPSNWNSQTKPTFDRPWEVPSWMGQEVPSWMGQDAPVKPEPPPLEPSLGNFYDLPAASNPIPLAERLRAASRDKGLDVDGPGDWSDDDEPYEFPPQPHITGTKQKVAFTATASSPKRSSHRPPSPKPYDNSQMHGLFPPQPHITGTKQKVGFTAQVSQSQKQRLPPRGTKRPNPAMDHVWATNQANQALKRAKDGIRFGIL